MVIDPRVLKRGMVVESKEHPTLPKKYVKMLVENHIGLYGVRAYPAKKRK